MPLLRYFVYVGGALLALILIVNWYLPPTNAESSGDSVDRSIIRIHSVQKWPAAVVFDTTQPTIVLPPAIAAAAAAVEPNAKPPREAFAMATEPAPAAAPAVKAAEPAKPAKPRVRHARVARPPGSRVASYDTFGFRNEFFGSRGMWQPGW